MRSVTTTLLSHVILSLRLRGGGAVSAASITQLPTVSNALATYPAVTNLTGSQLPFNDQSSPLLPPDVMPDVQHGDRREVEDLKLENARQLFHHLREYDHKSKLRDRKFVFGSGHRRMYSENTQVLDVDEIGDFDIRIRCKDNDIWSTVRVRCSLSDTEYIDSIVSLNKTLQKGNCRKDVGDLGHMIALGARGGMHGNKLYKATTEGDTPHRLKEAMRQTSRHVKKVFPQEAKEISEAFQRSGAVVPDMFDGDDVFWSNIIVSKNFANAPHFDPGDGSKCIVTWTEKCPGMAKNWYLVLPNATLDGKRGLAIRLRHGVTVAWDGRLIYHCTSQTDVNGDDFGRSRTGYGVNSNVTYGNFISTSKRHNTKK